MASAEDRFQRFMLTGAGEPAGATSLMPRDLRIDVIRGLALLIIFINHIPGHVLAGYTPHNFGFSDAADVFVLLAGVSATLAYGAVIERRGLGIGVLKIGARLWTLYIAHLAVFILVCGVVATAVTRTHNPLYIEAINIQPFFDETLGALVKALTLTFQPSYLDILPLYIVILASFPLVYRVVCASPMLALLASAAIWHVAGATGLNLPNGEAGSWFFNPFAWQLLFVLGVVMGRATQQRIVLPRSAVIDGLAVFVVLASLAVKLSTGNPFGLSVLNEWIESLQLGTDKTNLAAIRVVHLLSLAWLVIRIVPADARCLQSGVAKRLATVGQKSLEVFCLGTVLSIVAHIVLTETAFAMNIQLLVAALGIGLLIGFATFLTWYETVSGSQARADNSAVGRVVAR